MNRWIYDESDSGSDGDKNPSSVETPIKRLNECIASKNPSRQESSDSDESTADEEDTQHTDKDNDSLDENGNAIPPWVRFKMGPREYKKMITAQAEYNKLPGKRKQKCKVCKKYQSFQMMLKGKTKCQTCFVEYEPRVKFDVVAFRRRQCEYQQFVEHHLERVKDEVEKRRLVAEAKLVPPKIKRVVRHKSNWRNDFASVSHDVGKVFKDKVLAASRKSESLPKVEESLSKSTTATKTKRRPHSAIVAGSSSRSLSFNEPAVASNLKQTAALIATAPVDEDDVVELARKFDEVLSSVITGANPGAAVGGSRNSLPSVRVDSWSVGESCADLVMIIKLNAKESLEKADCHKMEGRAPERSVSFSTLQANQGAMLPLPANRRGSVLKWSNLAATVAQSEQEHTDAESPEKLIRASSMTNVAAKTPTKPKTASLTPLLETCNDTGPRKVARFGVATRPMGKVLHYPLAVATLPEPVDPVNFSGIYCVSMTLQSKIFSVDDNPDVSDENSKFRYSEAGRLSVEYSASENHGDYDFTFGLGLKPCPQSESKFAAETNMVHPGSPGSVVFSNLQCGLGSPGSPKRQGSIKNSTVLRKLYQKYGSENPLIESTAAFQCTDDKTSCIVGGSVVDDRFSTEQQPIRQFTKMCHDGFGSCVNSWGVQCPVEVYSIVKGHKKLRSNKRASFWSHGGAAGHWNGNAGAPPALVEKLPRNVVMKAGNIIDVVVDLKKQEAYLCISRWVYEEKSSATAGTVNNAPQAGKRQLLYMKRVSLVDVLHHQELYSAGPIKPEDILVGCTIPAGYDAVIIVPGDESKYNAMEKVSPVDNSQAFDESAGVPKQSWRNAAKSFADKFDDIKKHIARTHIPDIKLDISGDLPPMKSAVARDTRVWESNLAPLNAVSGKEWNRAGLVTETEDPIRLTLDMYDAMLHPVPTMTNEEGDHHDEHHDQDCPVLWLKGVIGVVPKEALKVGHLMPTEVATSIEEHNSMADDGVHVFASRFQHVLGIPDLVNKKTRASSFTALSMHNEIKSMKAPTDGTMPNFPDLSGADLKDLKTLDKNPNLKHLSMASRTGGSLLDKKTVSYVCTSCFEFAYAASYYIEYVKVDNTKDLVNAFLYEDKETNNCAIANYTKGAKTTKVGTVSTQEKSPMATDPRVKIVGPYQPRKRGELESILNIADVQGKMYHARIVCAPAQSNCDYLLHMLHNNVKYVWKKGACIYNEPDMFDEAAGRLPAYTVYPPIYAVAASHGPLKGMHQYIVRYCPNGQHGILSGRYDVLTEYIGLLNRRLPSQRNMNTKDAKLVEADEKEKAQAKAKAEEDEAERIRHEAHAFSAALDAKIRGSDTRVRDDFDDTEELLHTFKELQREQDELAHHHQHTHGHKHVLNNIEEHKEKAAVDEPIPIIPHGIPGYRILRSRMWCFASDTHKLHVEGMTDNYTCLVGGCEQFAVMRDMEFLCVGK